MTKSEVVPFKKDELVRWLSGVDLDDETDTAEMDYAAAIKILGADSLAEALTPERVIASKALIGERFAITAVRWMRSTKSQDGERRYALLSCVDANGEPFLTSCGATKVVLAVLRMERDALLPCEVVLGAIETGGGNTMLQLEIPAPDF